MKSATARCRRRGRAGFTLVEVLAAMLFLALVIPVAFQALRVAAAAGEVAGRKERAARVAERMLYENILTTNWNQTQPAGTVTENGAEYQWTIRNTPWPQDAMQLLTAEVKYSVQDRDCAVRLSTLVNMP